MTTTTTTEHRAGGGLVCNHLWKVSISCHWCCETVVNEELKEFQYHPPSYIADRNTITNTDNMTPTTTTPSPLNKCVDDKEHVWVDNTFCDNCNKSFEEWLRSLSRRISHDIITTDLTNELDKLVKRKNRRNRMTKEEACQLRGRILVAARKRGYL